MSAGKTMCIVIFSLVMTAPAGLAAETAGRAGAVVVDSSDCRLVREPVNLADQLVRCRDAWHRAVQERRIGEAAAEEKHILGLLVADLSKAERQMRRLADVVLDPQQNDAGTDPEYLTSARHCQDADLLEFLIADLNNREACYRAFSQEGKHEVRYRRLGDYIGLVRRQTGMPGPDFAWIDRITPEK
ncbi:MAG: hypothetical protein KKA42_11100 [candidate division Zixibacteria bacterium]|nr:hypothetical protein [candidate division Zixibacteria bacterium]